MHKGAGGGEIAADIEVVWIRMRLGTLPGKVSFGICRKRWAQRAMSPPVPVQLLLRSQHTPYRGDPRAYLVFRPYVSAQILPAAFY